MTSLTEIASTTVTAQESLHEVNSTVNPITNNETMQGNAQSTSHNLVSVSSKALDYKSYAENFRHIETRKIDKTTSDFVYYELIDVEWVRSHLGLPGYSDADGNMLAFGVKFGVEFKFTLYSFSQQQGALIFATLPANLRDLAMFAYPYVTADLTNFDPKKAIQVQDMTQLNHKLVSFGGETQVYMRLPFMSTHDFYTYGRGLLGTIMVRMFNNLECVEGVFDEINLKVEARCYDYQLFGAAHTTKSRSFGEYLSGKYT